MGSLKSTSSTRCRYAACFSLGFVVASLILAAMFWIIWCYLGLTVVQVSDTQRRALVNYSYTTPKPPTTSNPPNRTEADGALESSFNAISKALVTPPSQPQPRRRSDSSTDLAKGDFAVRPPSQNSTRRESITPSAASSSHERKASILNKGEEDVLHPRKVSTSNGENRAPEDKVPEIKPTQTYAPAEAVPLPIAAKDERSSISRDSDRKDEVQSSRPLYRDPDFEREPPPRRYDTGRRRFDEDDYDDRGSPSRYDKRDRGRDTDDRYSKGDTRVYPDEKPRHDDRYPPRDSDRRRGDDRDREDRYRDKEEKPRDYDDRYRDYDRYKDDPRRDEDRYSDDRRYLDDDRTRRRDDRLDYDDKYRPKEDRYRPDDRYPPRNERYPDDVDRPRDRPYEDRRDRPIPREDDDRYPRPRDRDRDYRDPIMSSRPDVPLDRKSERPEDTRRPTDYDAPIRDRPRTSYVDESRAIDRYPNRDDEYLKPSRYDDRDRVSPTRTRDEAYISRSTVPLSRHRDDSYYSRSSISDERRRDDDRPSSNRDRSTYFDDGNRRGDESRNVAPSSVREREVSRDGSRTRLPDDRKLDDVGLERRSYSAEEEEEYRRKNSRTRYYDDADRPSPDASRRDYRTDEDDYPRRTRTDDDEYHRSRPRGDYDTDKPRGSDRYDRPVDDGDRSSRRKLPEYDERRRTEDSDIGLRKEYYSRDVREEDRKLPRPPERRPPAQDRRYDEDAPARRTMYEETIEDRPVRSSIDRVPLDGRRRDDKYPEDDRRYKDVIPAKPDDLPRNVPLRSEKRQPFVDSSTSPRDVVIREKRYPNSERSFSDSGKEEDRPINTKDVIEAAQKHSDVSNRNPENVYYPNFNPRLLNLTSTDYIPLSDRKGTIISSRKRRSRTY